MLKVKINSIEFLVKSNISVIEACEYVGINLPRFCYQQQLSVSGNCRMCLVELVNSPKPVAACALPILNNMEIFLNTPLVKKARENVLESLLLNHPLDCPICDQGGECDLQEQSKIFGSTKSRFFFKKRGVEDKYFNLKIRTIMTRCINCTKCVRFNSEITGNAFLGILNRGVYSEIGSYNRGLVYKSEISGNVIDICPVGALTSADYSFKSRPWKIKTTESIDLSDNLGSNIYIDHTESEILRVYPKVNEEINGDIITDRARYYFDYHSNNRLTDVNKDRLDAYTSEIQSSDKDLRILILVDSNLDLENLAFMKFLEEPANKYITNSKKTINFIPRLVKGFLPRANGSIVRGSDSKISDINSISDVCVLIGTNLEIDNPIFNAKLIKKQKESNLKIFGYSVAPSSTLDIEHVSSKVSDILLLLEGKSEIAKLLKKDKKPLILYGNQLFERGYNKQYFIENFKKINPNIVLLHIYNSCNQEAANILEYEPVSSRDLKTADYLIAVNLDESITTKRLLNKFTEEKNKKIVWINTHKSETSNNAFLSLPCTTEYEEEKTFINLEQRVQKTAKIFDPYSKNVKSISLHLNDIFKFRERGYFKVCEEDEKELFSFLMKSKVRKKTELRPLDILSVKPTKILIGEGPLLPMIDDPYLVNKDTFNSINMHKLSREFKEKNSGDFGVLY